MLFLIAVWLFLFSLSTKTNCIFQDLKKPVGVVDLSEKNLQLQDYTVITINTFAWNAMQMNVPDAKSNFFKQKFNISTKQAQSKFPFSAMGATDAHHSV